MEKISSKKKRFLILHYHFCKTGGKGFFFFLQYQLNCKLTPPTSKTYLKEIFVKTKTFLGDMNIL